MNIIQNEIITELVKAHIRPLCEQMRDLKIRIEAADLSVFGIESQGLNDTDTIEENRDDGVQNLSVQHVQGIIDILNQIVGLYNQDIEEACVRDPYTPPEE